MGINEWTFTFVIDNLDQLHYKGPVILSCDDTKLLPSWRPYYDDDRKGYYLMGHVGEPIILPDPDTFRMHVKDHNLKNVGKFVDSV